MLKFISGNVNKFKEFENVLKPFSVSQLNVDLDEIQEIDPVKIIKHKLFQASTHYKGEFIIEDSSLYLSCLNNKLPGPLEKWFEQALKLKDFYNLCEKLGNFDAEAQTLIGYSKNGRIKIFKGKLKGKIVKPVGNKDFGYGPIFQPFGYKETYGQMDRDLKNQISSRAIAIKKLKKYLSR